ILYKIIDSFKSTKTIAYGFNYLYNIEGKAFVDLQEKLKDSFIKEAVSVPNGTDLLYVLPQLTFKTDTGEQITVSFQTQKDLENKPTDNLKVLSNVHLQK